MIIRNNKKSLWFTAAALVLAFLFFADQVAGAYPFDRPALRTLRTQSIFQPLRDAGVEVSAQMEFEVLSGIQELHAGKTPLTVNSILTELYGGDRDKSRIAFLAEVSRSGHRTVARFVIKERRDAIFEVTCDDRPADTAAPGEQPAAGQYDTDHYDITIQAVQSPASGSRLSEAALREIEGLISTIAPDALRTPLDSIDAHDLARRLLARYKTDRQAVEGPRPRVRIDIRDFDPAGYGLSGLDVDAADIGGVAEEVVVDRIANEMAAKLFMNRSLFEESWSQREMAAVSYGRLAQSFVGHAFAVNDAGGFQGKEAGRIILRLARFEAALSVLGRMFSGSKIRYPLLLAAQEIGKEVHACAMKIAGKSIEQDYRRIVKAYAGVYAAATVAFNFGADGIAPREALEPIAGKAGMALRDVESDIEKFYGRIWSPGSADPLTAEEHSRIFDHLWAAESAGLQAFPETLKRKLIAAKMPPLMAYALTAYLQVDEMELLRQSIELTPDEDAFVWEIFHGADPALSNRGFEAADPGRFQPVLDALHAIPGRARVLDLGCGTHGVMIKDLKRVFPDKVEGYGIDIALDEGRSGDVELRRGDIRQLPYEDGYFDVVYEAAVMQYYQMRPDERDAIMREIARVLKPGGRLIVMSLHPDEGAAGASALPAPGGDFTVLKEDPLVMARNAEDPGRIEQLLSAENAVEKGLSARSARHLAARAVNEHIDVSAIHGDPGQLRQNMKTLARLIASHAAYGLDVRYILDNDADGRALEMLQAELADVGRLPGVNAEELLSRVGVPHAGDAVMTVYLATVDTIRKMGALTEREFAVALKDDADPALAAIPNYAAASAIGLSLAALRAARESGDREGYEGFRGKVFAAIRDIYTRFGIVRDGSEFTVEDLEFVVSGCAANKLKYAIVYALPPIVKDAVDRIQRYHEHLQMIMQSA